MACRPNPDIPSHRRAWSWCSASDAIVVEVDGVTGRDGVIAAVVEGCIGACCDGHREAIVEVVEEADPTSEKAACSHKAILEERLRRHTRDSWSVDASGLGESLAEHFAQEIGPMDSVGAAAESRPVVSSSETTGRTVEHCPSCH